MSALEPLTNQAERLEWLPDGMNYRGTWSASTQYVKNDVVISLATSAAYVANINILGGADPANVAFPSPWTQLGGGNLINNATQTELQGNSGGAYNIGNGFPNFRFLFNQNAVALQAPLTSTLTAANTLMVIVQGVGLTNAAPGSAVLGCGANNLGQGATDVPFPLVGALYYFNNTTATGQPLLGVPAIAPGVNDMWATQYFSWVSNGNTSAPTQIYILKKGVDYNESTTFLQFGASDVQGASQGNTYQDTILNINIIPLN